MSNLLRNLIIKVIATNLSVELLGIIYTINICYHDAAVPMCVYTHTDLFVIKRIWRIEINTYYHTILIVSCNTMFSVLLSLPLPSLFECYIRMYLFPRSPKRKWFQWFVRSNFTDGRLNTVINADAVRNFTFVEKSLVGNFLREEGTGRN